MADGSVAMSRPIARRWVRAFWIALAILSGTSLYQGSSAFGQTLKLEAEPEIPDGSIPITEDDVFVEDGDPEQLMDIIDHAARNFGDPESSKRIKAEQVFIIAKAAQKVRLHPEASDRERELADVLKITYLNYGTQLDEKLFAEPLSRAIDSILEKSPKGKAAPLASAYRIMRLWTSQPEDKGDYLPQLTEFQAKYPDNLIGIQLFDIYAGRLLANNRTKDAREVYEKAMALYEKHPAMPAMREGFERLQRLLARVGTPMDYSMSAQDDSMLDLDTLKDKVVLVQFWASNSPFCRQETENVKEMHDKYHSRGFEVVGIAMDENEEPMKEFLEDAKTPWPHLFSKSPSLRGAKHPIAARYGVLTLPMIFVIDRQGKISSIGIRGPEAIEEAVSSLLGPEPKPTKSK